MTFLSSYSEKTYLIMQMTRKNYEKNILSNRDNSLRRKMQNIAKDYSARYGADNDDHRVEDDPDYIALNLQHEQIAPEMTMLDTDIQELNAQINSLNNVIKEGIKSSCGMTLSGGSS